MERSTCAMASRAVAERLRWSGASRATHLSDHSSPAAAQEMAKSLLRSSLQPLAADLLSPAAAAALGLPSSGWTLAVLVGGVAAATRRQIDDLAKLALGAAALRSTSSTRRRATTSGAG